jgi:hypothetical protein
MMLKVAKLGTAIAAVLVWIVPAAYAGVPDVTKSFYTPQSGTTTTPTVGAAATVNFRMCPNNDGGASLPNSARVLVRVIGQDNVPIQGISASDICILFNGGTPQLPIPPAGGGQGFSGVGADSVIANSTYNFSPLCPDVRCVAADAPTNANGETYITFTGANVASPGVGLVYPNNNRSRKWGHYDSELPVYVLGFKIPGRITVGDATAYFLRIKNFDWTGGLTSQQNVGEAVTITDFNGVANTLNVNNVISYWKDFNFSGAVTVTDLNILAAHLNHNCGLGLGGPGVP